MTPEEHELIDLGNEVEGLAKELAELRAKLAAAEDLSDGRRRQINELAVRAMNAEDERDKLRRFEAGYNIAINALSQVDGLGFPFGYDDWKEAYEKLRALCAATQARAQNGKAAARAALRQEGEDSAEAELAR